MEKPCEGTGLFLTVSSLGPSHASAGWRPSAPPPPLRASRATTVQLGCLAPQVRLCDPFRWRVSKEEAEGSRPDRSDNEIKREHQIFHELKR